MGTTLARSYAYCEGVARREAGNFYHAFRVLPTPQRRAMCALYAFLRVTDDLSDGPGDPDAKRQPPAGSRRRLHPGPPRPYSHRPPPPLPHTVAEHAVPPQYLHDVLDGVEMDLEPVRYATFPELRRYCYRVASAVGLACIHIWGFRDARAKDYAESAGLAFQ